MSDLRPRRPLGGESVRLVSHINPSIDDLRAMLRDSKAIAMVGASSYWSLLPKCHVTPSSNSVFRESA